jgi:hypothetical protein
MIIHKCLMVTLLANVERMNKFTKLRRIVKGMGFLIDSWKGSLFYTQLYFVLSESVFHIIIQAIIRAHRPEGVQDSYTEIFSNTVSVICLLLFAFLVFISSKITRVSVQILNQPHFMKKHGFLYSKLRYKSGIVRAFSLQFILRRVLMALIFIFLQHLNGIQIQLLMMINVFITITVNRVEFYQKKTDNIREVINETFISFLTIILVLFTDFCDKIEFQFYIGGWSFISIFSSCILFNLGILVSNLINNFELIIIKNYNKIKRWYDIRNPQAEQEEEDPITN